MDVMLLALAGPCPACLLAKRCAGALRFVGPTTPMKGSDRYRVEGVSCRLGGRPLDVVNLSVGGLFVASSEAPPVGQSVSFEVTLPRAKVQLVGQIAWINERGRPRVKGLPPGFGIKIVRIAFPDKMALLAYLREVDPSALRKQ